MAFTDTTALANTVQTAYDQAVRLPLRDRPMWRDLVDVRPEQQPMPGSAVVLQKWVDFADTIGVAPSALTETVDVTADAMSNTTPVTVTPVEYGQSNVTTIRLHKVSFAGVETAKVNLLARSMLVRMDNAALATLRAGTNRLAMQASGAISLTANVNTITNAMVYGGKAGRYVAAKMRAASVEPRVAENYVGVVHPDVSLDFREETGSVGWRAPHEYSSARNIWAGAVGVYDGIYYIETPRIFTANDGSTSAKVYRSIFLGQGGLAEATAIEPHVVMSPQTDSLRRFFTLGWYGFLGWSRFYEEAIWRVESGSSVNAVT